MAVMLWLVRHGETAWSLSGQHTGTTDVPLTEHGREQAVEVGKLLQGKHFALVLTSPMGRARETCRLAGIQNPVVDDNLREWDYGDYEGLSTPDVQKMRPGWSLWKDGVVHGETVEEVGERAKAVITKALAAEGEVLLVAHGHILRILTACWLGLPADDGRLFALETATLSSLGYEHQTRVIRSWNSR
ncbi:MAG: histidine phosphatase family protein [Acidobacteriaceae bacterium]